jgi:hypothetical protein
MIGRVMFDRAGQIEGRIAGLFALKAGVASLPRDELRGWLFGR